MAFVHLHCHSPFSFLDGAATIQALVARAAEMGMPALALTDHDNLCGAVQFQKKALAAGVKPIQGVEVTLENGHHLVLLAKGPEGYSNLCRILTGAHLGNPRLHPKTSLQSLSEHSEGLFALSGCRRGEIPDLILHGKHRDALAAAIKYREIFGPENLFLELEDSRLPGDAAKNRALAQLADHLGLGIVASANVHYLGKDNFPVHDLLTCVRTLTKLEEIHPERRLNAENYLKDSKEMAELFRDFPLALENSVRIAEECEPALNLNTRLFPAFPVPDGETPAGFLRKLVYEGATRRYGRLDDRITHRLEHELNIICRLGYEEYFLLVWDVARYAREKGIRCAGRGSAADSAVAYCLFITDVDAIGRGLLFERFMSLERAEKPDIDIDFDTRYRDKVAEYVYQKYGRDRVAAVCTYNTFHGRSAIRDFGKAMGFVPDEIDRIAKRMPYFLADDIREAIEKVPELRNSDIPFQKFEQLITACEAVAGYPRFMGTHLGGLVISREPLTAVTPLQMAAKGVVVCQFDKEYVEDLGLVKLDLLSLRTLSAVDDAVRVINRETRRLDYEYLTPDDRETYGMLNAGETIGVFQLESPAQRALQSRLEASHFEDLVASVAIIRPGPIKGNMVEPFIARRQGKEEVTYLHPSLKPILQKTYGVVLFQEQVIEIATAVAGFTPGEADQLRRVMTHARNRKDMEEIGREFVRKATARGVSQKIAETIFSYIAGYASYGFCEAHAAAFANIAYKTAYLVKHFPAEFFAAILSHQPMGYYPPNTLCTEARRRGINILPPDINRSGEAFTVEEGGIRVSLKQVKGMSEPALKTILQARSDGPFLSLEDFCRRTAATKGDARAVPRDIIENLILCGAFDPLHSNRRELIWRLPPALAGRQAGRQGPLELDLSASISGSRGLADFSAAEKFIKEFEILGIMVRGHYMGFLRKRLSARGFLSSSEVKRIPPGTTVKVAGLVVRPHRPPTKSGKIIVFMSLEDEDGLVDVTVFEDIYQRYGQMIFAETVPPLAVLGKAERRGNGVCVIAERIKELG